MMESTGTLFRDTVHTQQNKKWQTHLSQRKEDHDKAAIFASTADDTRSWSTTNRARGPFHDPHDAPDGRWHRSNLLFLVVAASTYLTRYVVAPVRNHGAVLPIKHLFFSGMNHRAPLLPKNSPVYICYACCLACLLWVPEDTQVVEMRMRSNSNAVQPEHAMRR